MFETNISLDIFIICVILVAHTELILTGIKQAKIKLLIETITLVTMNVPLTFLS